MKREPAHWLKEIAAQQSSDNAVGFYQADGTSQWLTYGDLYTQALVAARRLRDHGLTVGDRALILCGTSPDFVITFFACMFSGVIAVPVYPPRSNRKADRILAIAKDCSPTAIVTPGGSKHAVESIFREAGVSGKYIDTAELITPITDPSTLAGIRFLAQKQWPSLSDLAFLQYTSGSTGTPKGVMVTHQNLSDNLAAVALSCRVNETSRWVSWLPLHHDLGLINGLLTPLYSGGQTLLVASAAFFNRPVLWLELLASEKATHSAAPNFAYELCVERMDEDGLASLDLSSCKYLMNAAEPVRYETLQRFTRRFARAGLSLQAVKTCYGMAEATLVATYTPTNRQPRVIPVALDQFGQHAVRSADETQQFKPVVSCGVPAPGCEICIIDPVTGKHLPDDVVGEVVIQSPSVAMGYWNRVAESEETFGVRVQGKEGVYLRTGDLGFINAGELFFTGRCKDLIISRGRNIYPQDIEKTVEEYWLGFRKGHAAAFSLEDAGSQQLVVVQEVERTFRAKIIEDFNCEQLFRDIREVHELECDLLVLVAPNQIPMTSSGKIQRRATQQAFTKNELKILAQFSNADFSMVEEQVSARPLIVDRSDIAQLVMEEVARAVGVNSNSIDEHQVTADFGFDSILVAHLAQRLSRLTSIAIEAVWFLEAPTLAAVIDRIANELDDASDRSLDEWDPLAAIEELSESEARELFDSVS